uniref:Uncharacterized protein n=1 Tax=Brassica oleracea TaxID=3712 RepID=A0A3P6EQ62_BRAOL|nr:unnamed protein product [Brassica oleracea]
MGDFDFSRLPRNRAENIVHSGSSLMSDEIRGLIGVPWRGPAYAMPRGTNRPPPVIGGSEDEAERSQEVIATSSIQAQSLDRLARQLVRRSSFCISESASRSRASDIPPLFSIRDSDDEDVPGERRSPVLLSHGSEDEVVAAIRKLCRSSKAALPGPSGSRRESTVRGLVSEGDDPLFAALDDLVSLAGRMRSAGYRFPSLTSPTEKEAYAKVAVASSKVRFLLSFLLEDALRFLFVSFVMEAFNEYVVAMEDRVERWIQDRERRTRTRTRRWRLGKERLRPRISLSLRAGIGSYNIHRASRVARRDVAGRYREILVSLKEKWMNKKKEVSTEIQLQEVVANIDLLNELKDGGLTVDAELARLKEMGKDYEVLVTLAAVSDWSISELDLPQVSEDSVDQAGGSSVPDGVCSNMASRRPTFRESERIRNRAGGVSAERIRSGDVSEALT